MTLTHYIGGKITGDSTDFASLSTNYPNSSTFIDFETFTEYILVAGVWQKIGIQPPIAGWREIGRTTLGAPSDVISVSGLADKRYYMVLVDKINAGDSSIRFRFNSDGGLNYARRYSLNGLTDTTAIDADSMFFTSQQENDEFNVSYIANLNTAEKLMQGNTVGRNTVGAGVAPQRSQATGKHVQTTNPINEIAAINLGSGNYATGSEMVVLEWDPTDTHTDNFWQQLDTVTGTSSLDLSIVPRKYLWLQYYIKATGGTLFNALRVGNGTIDTGSNYIERRSADGATDTVGTTSTLFNANGIALEAGESVLGNVFIINNPTLNKLFIMHTSESNTLGAGFAPDRLELAGKWAVNQSIDKIQLAKGSGTGTVDPSSFATVWGHD